MFYEKKSYVKFAVFSDLHGDIVNDARFKLSCFAERCRAEQVDFIMQLGDFVQPPLPGKYVCPEVCVSPVMRRNLAGQGLNNQERVLCSDILKQVGCPVHHIVGNHDLDLYDKQQLREFLGMPADYYSFDVGGLHFVALDLNYYLDNNQEFELGNGNYIEWFMSGGKPFPYLPGKELEWLKQDLAATGLPVVIFSHEGINSGFLNAHNYNAIFNVLEEDGKTILCVHGHKHQDIITSERGIPVYGVNSMSGYSLPARYLPHYMAGYKDPLYAIITISEAEISIKGVESSFVSPSPDELGVSFKEASIVITPTTGSVVIKRK